MLCLALLAVTTVIGGAKLLARAKQTPTKPSADSVQGYSKKADAFADKIDPKTLATMRRQEALQPAVNALYEAAMKSPDSGFTSIAFEGDGLALYWKGELPTDMVAALNVAREIGPVEVISAAYSMAEMEAEAAKIHKAEKALGASDIQAVGARYDGSGLDIERMPAAAAEKKALVRARAGQPPLRSAEQVLAKADLRVPIRVTTADKPIELMFASRWDDSPAWNGGGYWEARSAGQVKHICTTGFGIRYQNRTWVLTSAHCATPPDFAYQGFDREFMGPVTQEHYQQDLILIDAPGFYRMFDNPQPPDGHPYKNVYGSGGPVANELLCQSGAASGVVCNLRTGSSQDITITSADPDSDGDFGYKVLGVFNATQINGQTAVRHGDSGGPVFTLLGDGVRAKGIVTGGAGGGSTMYYQDWPTVTSVYPGVVPVTP